MKKSIWIRPLTITGPPAEGDKYFKRTNIEDDFWELFKKGSHILFTAPRRVGKSSIMKNIVKSNSSEYLCVYENIESIKKSQDFYQRFFEILIKLLSSKKQILEKLKNWGKSKQIDEISVSGTIKISSREFDYKERLLELIEELVNLGQKVIIFLDEFPEVLNSIVKKEGKDAGIDILHTIRGNRQNSNFENITLVIAGSIGLEYVVESIDREKLINDLSILKIPPLKFIEAKKMIDQLTKNASMKLDDELQEYLLNKINYLVPFFIQTMIEECDSILRNDERLELTKKDIDQAFENIIQIYDSKFYDWEARLKDYLHKDACSFCKNILTIIAHEDKIEIQSVFDTAGKYKQKDSYMRLIKMLERDGYIIENDNIYQFVSPILKAWWQKQHPEFELKK